MSVKFNWLHFSDIHVGVQDQNWLWPRSDTLLMKDLERVHKKAGAFDLIVFSGDLAQKGLTREYERFSEIIERILKRLEDLGSKPKLISVPGNHDLLRPEPQSAGTLMLRKLGASPELQTRFWQEYDGVFEIPEGDVAYKKFLEVAFGPYMSWLRTAIASGIHASPLVSGLLPGDASYHVECEGGRCGIVGLNSSWLQLGAGSYHGQLHLEPRQLLAVTGDRPDEWASQNSFNLLVTHHPSDWLDKESLQYWNSDINPPGRFDLHLFGHMHEASSTSTSLGGGAARRAIQSASLFGLELFDDGSKQRIQGYTANQMQSDSQERCFTHWPRIEQTQIDGARLIVPDTRQKIDEDTGAIEMRWLSEKRSASAESKSISPSSAESCFSDARRSNMAFDLSTIQHHVPDAKAHTKVRRVELQRCLAALKDERAVWLISDWGMGSDGFVAAIRTHHRISIDAIYRLDLSSYENRQSFLEAVRMRHAASFEQICEAISEAGSSILLLDNIDLSRDRGAPEGDLEADIERLVEAIRDFAPQTLIFARTQRAPTGNRLTPIELRALDEADVAIYARESELGGERYAKPDAVGTLFRHTDGIPNRLDTALRDLELVSLNELLASNSDISEGGANVISAPPALAATINELRFSHDEAERRTYRLLSVLSAFPQGETLSRIKRFDGPHAFHLTYARTLLERSLIDTNSVSSLASADKDEHRSKVLVVPRTVRDYVRATMDEPTTKSIDRTALELFFGPEWQSGEIESSPTGKHTRSSLCDGYEIHNGSILILRYIRKALVEDNPADARSGIRLALAFTKCLIYGDHFRGAASLCSDVIGTISEFGGYTEELNFVRYELARSLRMTSRLSEARAVFETLDLNRLNKSQKQSAELGLALCCGQLGNPKGAADAAKRAIALDKQSSQGIQAQGILAEQIEDSQARITAMNRLLLQARKKGYQSLVANFLLDLAREERLEGKPNPDRLLEEILNARSKTDNYNSARAIVDLAANTERPLTSAELELLMDAYHYFYHERLYKLFDRCHDALWTIFESTGDITNLLNLFRHSSFIWRLNGREEQELLYLNKLFGNAQDLLCQDVRLASRDGAYFVVRVSVILGGIGNRADEMAPLIA